MLFSKRFDDLLLRLQSSKMSVETKRAVERLVLQGSDQSVYVLLCSISRSNSPLGMPFPWDTKN